MRTLHIDVETKSEINIKDAGAYKYIHDAEEFDILLMAWAFDNEPASVVDLTTEEFPPQVKEAILSPEVVKYAHNANFERNAFKRYFGQDMPPEQWRCTLICAAYKGLPLNLDALSKALKLGDDKAKLADGKKLVKLFTTPNKPSKKNPDFWNTKHTHPEEWIRFMEYCRMDVEAERAVHDIVGDIPDDEQKLWCMDQRINDRGVGIDLRLVNSAISMSDAHTETVMAEAIKLTDIDNPNSNEQIKQWLIEQTGEEIESLNKKAMPEVIERICGNDKAMKLISLRNELSKSSVKKYKRMQLCTRNNGRAYGLIQHYGANRTGRAAGRLIQVQNLPQHGEYETFLPPLRDCVIKEGAEIVSAVYGPVADCLSALVRTAIVPADGFIFAAPDFSAIEARVLAWVAGEKWRLDVFNTHGKIYEASASMMFKVPLESITKKSPYRQRGKVAELALGYGGGKGALMTMDTKKEIAEDEYEPLVRLWREASPAVCQLWQQLNRAVIHTISTGEGTAAARGLIRIGLVTDDSRAHSWLVVRLPSGRRLHYYKPFIKEDPKFGSPCIHYWGVDQTKKVWFPQKTYGGKLTENIVQAIARDCLYYAMYHCDKAGFQAVIHVHDEIVFELPIESAEEDVKRIEEIMSKPAPWAEGLPLAVDTLITPFYRK